MSRWGQRQSTAHVGVGTPLVWPLSWLRTVFLVWKVSWWIKNGWSEFTRHFCLVVIIAACASTPQIGWHQGHLQHHNELLELSTRILFWGLCQLSVSNNIWHVYHLHGIDLHACGAHAELSYQLPDDMPGLTFGLCAGFELLGSTPPVVIMTWPPVHVPYCTLRVGRIVATHNPQFLLYPELDSHLAPLKCKKSFQRPVLRPWPNWELPALPQSPS